MKEPLRLAAVISSLQAGGAERVLSRLLNHWAEAGWTVTVFTFETPGSQPFYPLNPQVNYCPLGLAGASRNILEALTGNFRRLRGLRRALWQVRPQVVLSFCAETNVTALGAAWGLNLPLVVSERAPPASHRIGRSWRWGRRWLYPRAKFIVVQTQEAANFFPIALRARLRVIPNPIVRPALLPVRRERRLLAVGRLEAEKGFDLLLRTFAFARGDAPDWKLRIIGEGSARPALLRQAADLGLSEVLELPGLFRNIEGEYAEAGAFVLSSRYEGFPNALCEAMAAGMAIAAFACPGGVREIVQDGINGLLAPPEDVAALAVQLARLLGEESLRLRLGKCAVEVAERFSSERVFEDWTRCLRAAVQP